MLFQAVAQVHRVGFLQQEERRVGPPVAGLQVFARLAKNLVAPAVRIVARERRLGTAPAATPGPAISASSRAAINALRPCSMRVRRERAASRKPRSR